MLESRKEWFKKVNLEQWQSKVMLSLLTSLVNSLMVPYLTNPMTMEAQYKSKLVLEMWCLVWILQFRPWTLVKLLDLYLIQNMDMVKMETIKYHLIQLYFSSFSFLKLVKSSKPNQSQNKEWNMKLRFWLQTREYLRRNSQLVKRECVHNQKILS